MCTGHLCSSCSFFEGKTCVDELFTALQSAFCPLLKCTRIWQDAAHMFYSPSFSLGMQANTVPTIAKMLQTTIRTQSSIRSCILIELWNVFKWKATGKITQMVKQRTEPISAMMVSKFGITIAISTMTTRTNIRVKAPRDLRMNGDLFWRGSSGWRARGSRPRDTSTAEMIGAQLCHDVGMIQSKVTWELT